METSNGEPSVITRSASLPASSEPTRSAMPMLRRVDGDGPERVKRVHARLYGHTGAERQILLRDDRAVGDDRHVAARTAEDAGRFPRLVADLHLGRKVERRADRHAQPGLCQLVRDQMPLGRMLERQANAEFVGDADGGEDIIRAVRVRLERDLPTQDGDERLKLHIECGLPEHIVPGGLFFSADTAAPSSAPRARSPPSSSVTSRTWRRSSASGSRRTRISSRLPF